ncbi:unannotated protein [freshwater metagenome]|uniref:Unannotated protein n=1 Tax=freshwater metagenome TaxID=449393 RepID=A0A6J7FBW6_9ZZZZ|nr:hypothetical protein [Actinomycetota bacterium]
MKRIVLIAGGTLGGLGAVLAITPPQLSSSQNAIGTGLGITPEVTSPTPATTKTATPAATKTATPKSTSTKTAKPTATKTSKPSASASASNSATASASASPTPSATKTQAAAGVSGTFTGDQSSVGPYGGVVVRITVAAGKITDAQAIQAPGGGNQRYTDRAVPTMRQRTLAAQSANITGVSGASYTSYNFWKSLTSALSKAGL